MWTVSISGLFRAEQKLVSDLALDSQIEADEDLKNWIFGWKDSLKQLEDSVNSLVLSTCPPV